VRHRSRPFIVGLAATAIAVSAVCGLSRPLAAASWSIAPGILPDQALEQLRSRHKDVRSAADLEDLLQDIGRRQPTLRLEANWMNNGWYLSGERARVIGEIEFALTTRVLETPLAALSQNYDGQVDSPEIRGRLTESVTRYLRKRGFFGATVRLRTENLSEDQVGYRFIVNEGEPCIIEKIELAFELPPKVILATQPGDVCDEEAISADVDRIALEIRDLGYNQSRIELAGMTRNTSRNTATVHIAGILGNRVRYRINDPSRRLIIDDLFDPAELSGIDPTIVGPDAMAAELSRRYRNRGYADVEITGPKIERSGGDLVTYVFDIEPGPQYTLRTVQFDGTTAFTDAELLETMGLTAFWQAAPPLNPESIRTGIDRVRGRYQEAGFWDVEVRERTPSKDRDDGTAQLSIRVDEGSQRILRQVIIQGNAAIPTSEIRETLSIAEGEPLDRTKIIDFQQSLRSRYVSIGWLYCDVTIDLQAVQTDRRVTPVTVVVTIKEGRRVKVGAISVVGLTRTKSKVVTRELLFATGDWYEFERITLSRRNLSNLGLFRSVQITAANRSALSDRLDELDLIVDVREGKAGNVSFGPGWSLADGWRYGSEASYNNLGGVGRQVSMRGGFSEERRQTAIGNKTLLGRTLGAGFTEPYVLDLPVDGKVKTSTTARAAQDAWELSTQGELALEHRLRHWLPGSTVAVFYGQKITREESDEARREALLSDDVRVGRVGLRGSIDQRDDLVFPTSGWTISPEVSWARYGLGGDLRYFRWDLITGTYFGITPNWVVAFGAQFTAFEDVVREGNDRSKDVLPPSERLFAGGADSVRGFGEGALGPLIRLPDLDNDGNWQCGYRTSRAGGSRRTVLKLELRHRINEFLAATSFVDSGNAFFADSEIAKFRKAFDQDVDITNVGACGGATPRRSVEDNVGYGYDELFQKPGYIWNRHFLSYGLALNFLTAIGSINLAYGLPWREPQTERCKEDSDFCFIRGRQRNPWFTRGELHLNVGARF